MAADPGRRWHGLSVACNNVSPLWHWWPASVSRACLYMWSTYMQHNYGVPDVQLCSCSSIWDIFQAGKTKHHLYRRTNHPFGPLWDVSSTSPCAHDSGGLHPGMLKEQQWWNGPSHPSNCSSRPRSSNHYCIMFRRCQLWNFRRLTSFGFYSGLQEFGYF